MTTPAPRRTLRWILLGSLGLNVALAAALVAPGLGLVDEPDRQRYTPNAFTPMSLRRVLTAEQREQLRPLWHQHRPEVRNAIREARQARRSLLDALRADELDRPTLERALADSRAHDLLMVEAGHRMLLDALLQLGPEQRRTLADQLEVRQRRPERSDRDRDRRDDARRNARDRHPGIDPRTERNGG